MFDYGVLRLETAGVRSKFVFVFCPRPDIYAQQILNARAQFERTHRGGYGTQPVYTPRAPLSRHHQPRRLNR